MMGILIFALVMALSFCLFVVNKRRTWRVREYFSDGDRFIFYMTGDGGYSPFSENLCRLFQKCHCNVISLDNSYFWGGKKLEEVTLSFEQVVRQVEVKKKMERMMVVGYSFGADITPFIVNHLSEEIRNRISEVVLLSPSKMTNLKIDLMSLFFPEHSGKLDVISEINEIKLPVKVVLNDNDSFSDSAFKEGVKVKRIPGNHHFDYHFSLLINTIFGLD